MKRGGALLAGAVLLLAGCVYYNSIYNADGLYREAERHRRAGRDSLATERYHDVIRKAARGYRREPEGQWASEALSLLGRARLRLGELAAARVALEQAAERAILPETRLETLVYLAEVLSAAGDDASALPLINEALGGLRSGNALAEGHLRRGSILLARGELDAGWWDLDRAADADSDVRADAAVERFRWAIRHDESGRAGEAVSRLLSYPEGRDRMDTVTALARAASVRWGPGAVAGIFASADSAAWGRLDRGRVRLLRARFYDEAGDTTAAYEEAWAVARGIGAAAAEARVQIARWRLDGTRDLAAIEDVAPILLPSGEHPDVERMLTALGALNRYTALGLNEPLGLFAAAEIARDELGAPILARGLFLAYADEVPADRWSPKALLAAIDVSPEEGDRAWLRGRLEAHGESPYVLAARGAPAPGYEQLEEELDLRLREIIHR